MGVTETVTELLEPVVASLGAELVDVEWSGSTLRLVVDAENGVTTDQLAKVNRMASPLLDQHDPVSGRYTLEVSSPGVERNLTRLVHYERAIGEDIIVKRTPGLEPRRFKGTLTAVVNGVLQLDVREIDGTDLKVSEVHEVPVADIDKAKTVFEWGPAPKPGGKKNQPNQKKKSAAKKRSSPAASSVKAGSKNKSSNASKTSAASYENNEHENNEKETS